ncbi:MAG: DUF58 domain-containing protein [Oscillospiraceae bacterium]|nr:DUF58 domain-containing protein [Oscillospiraceae bacterium]
MEMLAVALLTGILVIIFSAVYRNQILKGVEYTCSFSRDEVYEGDEIEFTEVISNRKLFAVPWMKSELTVPAALEFSELSSVVTGKTRWVTSFFALGSYSRISRTWRVKCSHRGVFDIERIIVTATDPLGFVKRYFVLNRAQIEAGKITVLPLREDCDCAENENSLVTGDIFTRVRLISDPFYINGIREYRTTDHMKNINWYATARSQQLMVNKNDFTTDRDVTIVLNIQSSETGTAAVHDSAYPEKCIRICAGLIHDNCSLGRRVRLAVNDITYGEMPDIQSSDEFIHLRTLAGLELQPGAVFDDFLNDILSECPDSEIIVITSFRTEATDIINREYPDVIFIVPEITGGED